MSLEQTGFNQENLANSLLKVYKSNRSFVLNTSYIVLMATAFAGATSTSSKKTPTVEEDEGEDSSNTTRKHPKLYKKSLLVLAKAIFPSITDKTIVYLLSHTTLLVFRAILSIKVANLDGQLVGALVQRRLKVFGKLLLYWMLIGIPASLTNALLTWSRQNLRRVIRINLNKNIIDNYLPDNLDANYYSLIHLSGNKIRDPNQRITTDVSRLSDDLSSLPGQLLKPSLDLILCARELSKSGVGNGEGTIALGIIAHFSTIVLRLFAPPFAKLASEKAHLEGQLRSSHSKIVTNNEEIAFLRGHSRELDYIDYCYYTLERFLKGEYWKKAIHEIAQTFIVKYFWGAAGLVLCSAPIFINKYLGEEIDRNSAGNFITNRRLLLGASDSLDRLMYSRKYLLQIIGHASRVSDFQTTLNEVISRKKSTSNVKYENDQITFDKVQLLTPANVTLIPDLTFSIKSGDHLLIAGPNGSGKSSMFRMLGGLWPVKQGTITIPTRSNMFYLPQRAYLCQGTLREQVIYPYSLLHPQKKSTVELQEILKLLKLEEYVDQLDEIKNWDEELSIGAQQRLAMARLYYHEPKFAVLDECTSAVSPDMEQFMYKHAQELGITVLSVAHRPALWHFHKYLLKFDGKGGYYFGKLDAEKRLKYEQERILLEKNLRDLPILKERLQELRMVSNVQHEKYGR